MRQRFAVLFEPRAVRDVEEARKSFAEPRARALELAVARALDRIEQFPYSSPRVRIAGKWSRTRRAALGRTGFGLYYRPNVRARCITVLAIWHERRLPPKL